LEDAYENPIADSDIGLIGRNIELANISTLMLMTFFRSELRFIDFAGGSGMFVRMMRDRGFDFYWFDRYTTNQFAKGFEGVEGIEYSLLTTFEFFEHMVDPLKEIEELLLFSKSILFSTHLVPPSRPSITDWWYYSPQTGQHISLYSMGALRAIARHFGLRLYSNGRSVHMLTKRNISRLAFRFLTIPSIANLLAPILRLGRKSLLDSDYFNITGRKLR
jgi:hypothetical protein